MLVTWITLLSASAATLEVALKDRVATLHVPGVMEFSAAFKAGPEATPVEATWSNVESNALAVACTDKGSPPDDDRVEQVVLQVGEDKWTLAPGSGVRFSCAAGSKVTVTDLHGTKVGTFPAPMVMTITKAKSRADH